MSKDMQKVRALLVGCGEISGAWLHATADMPDLEIVGLVDIDEERARNRAEEFHLQHILTGTDFEAALECTAPEVVFDCTVPEAHVDIATSALRAGCHVLGEKPLAHSMVAAAEILEVSKETGKLHAVIQNRRYESGIRRVRQVVAGRSIGPLTTLNADFYIGAHFGGFRDRMKHVLLLDMAIHTFDAARLISGTDPVSVYCKEWNPSGSWYDHGASAVAIFEMANGIVFTYRGSWCAEGLNTNWGSRWHAVGQSGSLEWDGGDEIRVQAMEKSGTFISECKEIDVPSFDDEKKLGGHAGVIKEFVQSVKECSVPETVCTDNIKSLAMVFGAIESVEKGRPVKMRK